MRLLAVHNLVKHFPKRSRAAEHALGATVLTVFSFAGSCIRNIRLTLSESWPEPLVFS